MQERDSKRHSSGVTMSGLKLAARATPLSPENCIVHVAARLLDWLTTSSVSIAAANVELLLLARQSRSRE